MRSCTGPGCHRFRLTSKLAEPELRRLHEAAGIVLEEWTERLRAEAGGEFPRTVTAFRRECPYTGRYRRPCPDCGAPNPAHRVRGKRMQLLPGCQTGGRILADRALSRLLREDWPRSLEDL